MLPVEEFRALCMTNETGKKVAVILPIGEFAGLLEDIEDLPVLARRRGEPGVPQDEVLEKLR